MNTRDSTRVGQNPARALAGFRRVSAASWDFLGDRGEPASHTRFSVICRRRCKTCAMLRGSIGMFCACSHRRTRAHDRSAQDFPLRPINSHAITRSRRRATRGDQDPEGDSRLHTGTRFRIRRSRSASSTSPKVAHMGPARQRCGPQKWERGRRIGQWQRPGPPFFSGTPEKRDRIEGKAGRWRASSEARKR